MSVFKQFESAGSTDGDKSSASESTSLRQITDLLLKNTSLEPPAVPLFGESRYLTQLWVFGNREKCEELQTSDASLSRVTSFEPKAEKTALQYEIKEKIRAAIKLLTFREKRVLVQFWSPHVLGKHRLLTTLDQPFGLGAVDEGLFLYRKDSECNPFIVDKDHEEEDSGPPARVYRRGLPEWTCDITNYMPKDFPLQECAIRCNLFGYLALPVMDSTTRLCVGVFELLMSSKYMGYAYEVKQIHNALKTMNLTSPQVFDYPTSNVPSEKRQNRLDKILSILKNMCDTHGLPLAQTWAVSPFSSYVAHEKILEKSCSSFNTKCIGKVCLSTSTLPFYVQDLSMWHFREACREQHLEKSRVFVGRALSSHGSCFCGDVSQLSEEEYPLVHNARMSGLTGCFTIFLHDDDDDDDEYVLEFFLPADVNDGKYVPKLVQTLEQMIKVTSGFKLGDVSSLEVVPPSKAVKNLSFDIEPYTIQISSPTEANTLTVESDSSDSEANVAKTAIVPSQWSPKLTDLNNRGSIISNTETLAGDDVIVDNVNVVAARKINDSTSYPNTHETITDGGNTKRLRQGRKRKIDSLKLEAVEQHLGKPIGQAAKSLGVSRSTLKRFCREHNIRSWPVPKNIKKSAIFNDLKLSKNPRLKLNLQRSSRAGLRMFVAVFVVVRVKRWSCASKHHGFSAKWWICGKHKCISSESCLNIYQVVHLIMLLKQWKKRSIKRANLFKNYPINTERPEHTPIVVTPNLNDDWHLPLSDFVHASPKPSSSNMLDMGMLMVKVTYKEDKIRFPFSISSGLLELENEVAQRIKLQGERLPLRYRDEDDDLVLIACDADLRNLLLFSAGNTLKLIVQEADNKRAGGQS